MTLWTVPKLWPDETAFVLCGGTSVTTDAVNSLRGKNVIAVNRMYLLAPWAPYLFFGDSNLAYHEERYSRKEWDAYPGQKVTAAPDLIRDKGVHFLRKVEPPPGISSNPSCVAMSRSSAQGAMNFAVHLGCSRIVLVGVDNRHADNGRRHCHGEYPWKAAADTWSKKADALKHAEQSLSKLGIEVLNCSPISTLPFWPIVELNSVLESMK